METRALRSTRTTYTPSNRAATARIPKAYACDPDRSRSLLRIATTTMVITLILVPGGFRALQQNGMGWEAWHFSRYLIVPFILFHLFACWVPLALRYFRPGECRDVLAFLIATGSLFIQCLIAYGLFELYAVWYGAA